MAEIKLNGDVTMKNHHVMVVDDNGSIINVLELILMSGGHRVTTAMTKWEAMDKIQRAFDTDDPVEILITDIQLPIESGFSLADELKERDFNLPIIFITGFLSSAYEKELAKRDYVVCLEKPLSIKDLLFHVDNSVNNNVSF